MDARNQTKPSVLIIILLLFPCASGNWIAKLYNGIHHKGDFVTISGESFSSCENLLNIKICNVVENKCRSAASSTKSIATNDSCVRLFSSGDCSGSPLMAVRPGSACHSSWGVCGLINKVNSIGGCLSEQENVSGEVLDISPLSVSSGRIASPNYPKNYDDNTEVNWIITCLPEQKIKIKFTHFELEKQSICKFDRVTITEFNSQEAIFEGCSDKIPPPIISKSNQIIVKFKSDSSTTRRGFSLDWENCTECQPTNSITSTSSGLSRLIPIAQSTSTTSSSLTTTTTPGPSTCISDPLQKALIRIGRVSFHIGEFFSGNSYSDNITPGCHEMTVFFRRKVRSMNDACKVICLYSDTNCRGESVSTDSLDRNTQLANLTSIGWKNKISSWKPSLKEITC